MEEAFAQTPTHERGGYQTAWDETIEERKLGFGEDPFTRSQLDAKFGRGKWRPLPRTDSHTSAGQGDGVEMHRQRKA